jgi:hypothetical protein
MKGKVTPTRDLTIKVTSDSKRYRKKVKLNLEKCKLDYGIEDPYIDNICVDISKGKENIGYLSGIFFNTKLMMGKGKYIFDAFDSISGDTCVLYEDILTHDSIVDKCVGMDMNIFYIQNFFITEKYRNLGYGRRIIKNLDEILRFFLNHEIGCYAVIPSPEVTVE